MVWMKIAATDFDGTFCPIGQQVPTDNLAAVHRWQEAGHKFGIATGRGYSLISKALAPYDLKVDYLVCNNGAVSVDDKGRMIHCQAISLDILADLLTLPVIKSNDVPLLVFTSTHAYSVRPNPDMDMELVKRIEFQDVLRLQDVVQVSLKLATPAEAQQVSDDIHRRLPMLGGNINRSYLDINRSEANKGWGLMRMLEAGAWNGSEILAIGDDKNDLPKIERFGGFTMTTAKPFMQEAAAKAYDSVGQMLLEHL